MAGLHFDITGDNSDFLRKLEESKKGVRETANQIDQSGSSMEDMFKRVTTAAAAMGAGFTAKELVSNVINIRGEFQQLEVAFKTMLGSEKEANALLGQLVETAASTPFDLQGVSNGAKQLLAYGVAANDVNDTLVRLGDIAAGLSIPLNDLVYLYGTTMAQGRLFTMDLRQFQGRGIPLADELAKQFKVTKDEVGALVTAGKVGFPEVQKAIESLTNKGSKFGGLMEAQSKTITGQISNIEDAIDSMFNSIGKNQEGVINKSLSLVSSLVENWETVAKCIGVVVTAYGTYKAALIAVNVYRKISNKLMEEAIVQQRLAAMSGITLSNAEAMAASKTIIFNSAMKTLNRTLLSNPVLLLVSGLAALGTAIYAFSSEENSLIRTQNELNNAAKESAAHEIEEITLLNRLKGELSGLNKGTKEYNDVKQKIIDNYGKYYKGLSEEMEQVGLTTDMYNNLTKAINKSASARQYDNFMSEQESQYSTKLSDNLQNLRKGLEKKLGEETGSRIFTKIRERLLDGKLSFGEKSIYDIQGLDSESKKALTDISDSGFITQNHTLDGYISNIIYAQQSMKKLEIQAKKTFGISDNNKKDTKQKDDEIVKTKNKDYWEKQKKTAQGELDALSDIEAKGKKGNELRKKIASYDKKINLYSNTKIDADAENARKENDNYKKVLDKQAIERTRMAEDLQAQVDEANIKSMQNGSDKIVAQMEYDLESQLRAIDRQKEDLLQKKIESARAIWEANPNNKKKTFDASSISLSDEENAQFDSLYKSTIEADSNERLKAEADYMREYLKQYGTFQQQKLAITEEYEEKIKNAQTKGEQMSLKKQMDSSLLEIDTNAAQQNIDWQGVFGNLGLILKDQIQPTINNLKELVKYDKFKNSDITDQQKIYEILTNLERQTGSLGKDMFKNVATDLQLYRNSLNAYNNAQQREIEATNKLTVAKENLKKAEENGGDIETARKAVDEAQDEFNKASESVKFFGDKTAENAEDLKTSSEKARGALANLSNGLNQLKSGSLSQALEGVKNLGKTVGGKLGEAITNIDPTGIISGVLSILDILKDGISSIFVSLQDSIFGAIEGILKDVLNGDIIVKPLKNAFEHVGNILNTMTFGGFNSWFGSNAKEVAKTTERLTDSNDRLKQAVDNLKEEMSKSGGWKAIDSATKAEKDQRTINQQTMQILQAQMEYHGAHHSNAYNWDLNLDDYRSINETLRDYAVKYSKEVSKVYSLEDIYELTPEEMDYIRTYNVEMWKTMTEQGKYDKSEYWNNYADLAGQLDEITASLKETLTQVSFDNMKSSFIDSLMDMDKSAADMANDFTEYLTKSILNAKISDLLDKELQEFYDTWADYSKSDNSLSEDERDELRKRWQEITQKGVELRNEVASFTGYSSSSSSSQDSSSKGFETMSQDTGEELNGRFTALQISSEETKNAVLNAVSTLAGLSVSISERNNILTEIRNLIVNSNGYLEDIAKYTKELIGFKNTITNIEASAKAMSGK